MRTTMKCQNASSVARAVVSLTREMHELEMSLEGRVRDLVQEQQLVVNEAARMADLLETALLRKTRAENEVMVSRDCVVARKVDLSEAEKYFVEATVKCVNFTRAYAVDHAALVKAQSVSSRATLEKNMARLQKDTMGIRKRIANLERRIALKKASQGMPLSENTEI